MFAHCGEPLVRGIGNDPPTRYPSQNRARMHAPTSRLTAVIGPARGMRAAPGPESVSHSKKFVAPSLFDVSPEPSGLRFCAPAYAGVRIDFALYRTQIRASSYGACAPWLLTDYRR